MNTVAKGDAFEDVSYDLIKEELEGYRLGLIPASCKLKRKPKYYSDKRKGFITFDLSIEVYRSDTENMLMLWLIECKDYSSKNVPVDDVEEFESKVRQVTGLNAKAVMISTSPYSDGSYNVAKGYGIMLIEVSGNIAFNIILHRISVKEARKLDKLSEVIISEETYNDPIIQTHVHRRWNQNIERKLLLALVKYTRKLEIQNANDYVPYLSREYIEEIVDSLIDAVDQSNVSRGYGVYLDRLMTFLEEMFGLNFETGEDLGYDANDRKILGHCELASKKIFVDISLKNTDRFAFVLCHEIGHYFLHNKLEILPFSYKHFSDDDATLNMERTQGKVRSLEWQANYFAACLLLPKVSLSVRLMMEKDDLGLHRTGPLYVDEQRCNQDSFHTITGNIAKTYGTTKTTVIYRMRQLDLLDENYKHRLVYGTRKPG